MRSMHIIISVSTHVSLAGRKSGSVAGGGGTIKGSCGMFHKGFFWDMPQKPLIYTCLIKRMNQSETSPIT